MGFLVIFRMIMELISECQKNVRFSGEGGTTKTEDCEKTTQGEEKGHTERIVAE